MTDAPTSEWDPDFYEQTPPALDEIEVREDGEPFSAELTKEELAGEPGVIL